MCHAAASIPAAAVCGELLLNRHRQRGKGAELNGLSTSILRNFYVREMSAPEVCWEQRV